MDTLQTERLLLRLWRESDLDDFAEFYADEDASKFVGGPASRSRAWRRMAAELGHWMLRGHGLWAVEERQSGDLAGGVGLWRPEGWPELELTYWLRPSMQGQGFATEACRGALDYAFGTMRMDSVVSYIAPDNEASKRLAAKLGGRAEATIELGDFGPHGVYRYRRP